MRVIAGAYGAAEGALSDLGLTALRYLLEVAAAGTMTAAARRLRISQPTLSVAMKNLEARLGTSLLLRGPKGVVLTRTGDELARTAGEVLGLLARAGERIRGLETEEIGRFEIGCYHSLGAYFLPPFMRAILDEAPGIELNLWNATADEVRDAVVDRVVHFGVVVSPRPHPDLVIVELFRDVMGVFAAGGAGRRRRRFDRQAFLEAPLFHVRRIFSSQKVLEALRTRDLLPPRLLPCGDLELAKSLAFRGVGPAVLPYRVAGYNLPEGALRLVDPSLPFVVDTACLIYRADLHRTRAAMRVKDALLRRGRELDDGVRLPGDVARVR